MMANYSRRTGKVKQADANLAAAGTGADDEAGATGGDKGIRINGYQQVVEMLIAADPEFRESLLRRISRQDERLAVSLRQALARL